MPYCPKCDMEFIAGITICSDCKGPLAESRAAAKLLQQKTQAAKAAGITGTNAETDGTDGNPFPDHPEEAALKVTPVKIYIKKAEQYEDLRSSFSAFLLVGGLLLAVAALSFFNIINLPFAASSKIIYELIMLSLGLGALSIAFHSMNSARRIKSQVPAEELVTARLIEWFISHHSAETIDDQLIREGSFTDLSPEEQSLKRFELIQDIFLTAHDISDQSYADLLAEEIYEKLYE